MFGAKGLARDKEDQTLKKDHQTHHFSFGMRAKTDGSMDFVTQSNYTYKNCDGKGDRAILPFNLNKLDSVVLGTERQTSYKGGF